MTPIKLTGTRPDGTPVEMFVCEGEHGETNAFKTAESAEAWCKPIVCPTCGAPLESRYRNVCDACRQAKFDRDEQAEERRRFETAEKVSTVDGPVFCEGVSGGNDGYFSTLDDLYEALDDREGGWPEYAWACSVEPILRLCADRIIEDATQEAHEDWDSSRLCGVDAFEAACRAFEEANSSEVNWLPNYKVAVLLARSREQA